MESLAAKMNKFVISQDIYLNNLNPILPIWCVSMSIIM